MVASTAYSVLVVEDERGLADLYAEWISDVFTVHTAYTGEAAMDTIVDGVDVVLLDRRMPGLSGDEVLDRIREQELDCRVVIVSAVEPDFDVIELGFDDYLVKPITRADLVEAVERMQNREEYDRELQRYFAMVSKKATLEAEKRSDELVGNEEYQALIAELQTLRQSVDASLELLDREDLRAVLRDTVEGSPSPPTKP